VKRHNNSSAMQGIFSSAATPSYGIRNEYDLAKSIANNNSSLIRNNGSNRTSDGNSFLALIDIAEELKY
jgi:hypothetical protein